MDYESRKYSCQATSGVGLTATISNRWSAFGLANTWGEKKGLALLYNIHHKQTKLHGLLDLLFLLPS